MFLLAVIMAVGVCSGIAGADVIWNTFAPGDVFPTDTGTLISSTYTLASRFAVSGNDYSFDQLEFAAGVLVGTDSLDVSLRADSSGFPGSILESFPLLTGVPSSAVKLSVNSVTHPLLQNGSSYWIVVAPGASSTFGFWPGNHGLPPAAEATYADGAWVTDYRFPSVLRVSGSIAPVPEPSSFLAMFAGLGGLGGLLRCRRR